MKVYEMIEILMNYASIALLILGALTALTNIVVEVFKGMVPKLPTAIVTFVVAEALTLIALVITAAVMHISVAWYYGLGALVLGIVVAYAAMGNFDKIKEIVGKLKEYVK